MNVFETVLNILNELAEESEIRLDSRLQEDLGLDSIQMITLLMELEDSFQILLDESDMNPFELTTVENIITLVKKYQELNENEENN